MNTKLPKEKIALFDKILTYMRLAIKNSSLYPPGHPSFDSAIKSFKAALDQWMAGDERLTIGISADNVLLDGEFIKDDSDLYRETADYLHPRGIIAISFIKNIDMNELSRLFAFLKYDTETFSSKGGITRNIPATPHLVIKEIDYSSILTSAQSTGALDEKGVWKMLSSIDNDLKGGDLPESKSEFMKNFLKDSKRSAYVLNKVYKEALAGLSEKSTAEEIKNIFSGINRYFETHHTEGATDAKKEMAGIISSLDPMLAASLFQQNGAGENPAGLSEELFSGMTDDMIADFIVSVMRNEGAVNENFLKLFNKLSVKKDGYDGVTSLVADKLFDEKLVNINDLSDIQLSIKELFREQPDNDFVSQIYKMTVGILIDKNDEAARNPAAYSAITREYDEFLKEENLSKEKIRLLLDILWQENDPEGFKKVCGILTDSLHEVLNMKSADCILEIFDLFTGKLRPEQLSNDLIRLEVKNIIDKMSGPKMMARLISLIPGADQKTLKDIARALAKSEGQKDAFLEIFDKETDPGAKKKILSAMIASNDKAMIGKLFEGLGKGFAKRAMLRDLIMLCGDFKARESVPHLGKIVAGRPFLYTRSLDRIRADAIVSLGRIGTPQALEYVRKASGDRSRLVRAMCDVVLKPSEKGR